MGMPWLARHNPEIDWRTREVKMMISQISYSLVVILELSGILEVQYKEIIMSSINKNN